MFSTSGNLGVSGVMVCNCNKIMNINVDCMSGKQFEKNQYLPWTILNANRFN